VAGICCLPFSPLVAEPGAQASGNFKNAKNWRLETGSGVCFVQVKSVSNPGQWIRKRSEIWRIGGRETGVGLGLLYAAAGVIEFSL